MLSKPEYQHAEGAIPDCDISDLDLEGVSSGDVNVILCSSEFTVPRQETNQIFPRSLTLSTDPPSIYRIKAVRATRITTWKTPGTLITQT